MLVAANADKQKRRGNTAHIYTTLKQSLVIFWYMYFQALYYAYLFFTFSIFRFFWEKNHTIFYIVQIFLDL